MGCGRTAPKGELVRLTLTDSVANGARRVVLDSSGKLPGRGAYLCRRPGAEGPVAECVRLATRRNGLARALRSRVAVDGELVESWTRV